MPWDPFSAWTDAVSARGAVGLVTILRETLGLTRRGAVVDDLPPERRLQMELHVAQATAHIIRCRKPSYVWPGGVLQQWALYRATKSKRACQLAAAYGSGLPSYETMTRLIADLAARAAALPAASCPERCAASFFLTSLVFPLCLTAAARRRGGSHAPPLPSLPAAKVI